jgi:hypothetical protein
MAPVGPEKNDPRRYNLPTNQNEVAAFITNMSFLGKYFYQFPLLLSLPSIQTLSYSYANRPLWVRAFLTSSNKYIFGIGEYWRDSTTSYGVRVHAHCGVESKFSWINLFV